MKTKSKFVLWNHDSSSIPFMFSYLVFIPLLYAVYIASDAPVNHRKKNYLALTPYVELLQVLTCYS